MVEDPTGEVTELLQHLIRNRCVNDGTPESGDEVRNVELLASYLDGCGLDMRRYEPMPGRGSLLVRMEGRNPDAPSLMLMGHIDVVPANPERWRRDPFGGELVDGYVWGRGAIDMLNNTASMAVALRRLAESGFSPEGTLLYLAVADEETLGTYGARWLTENETDAVRADYVVTEYGGLRVPIETSGGPRVVAAVGERGTFWATLRVRGTSGHAMTPYKSDNALVKAAEVVRRLAEYRPETRIHEVWRRFVESMGLAPELSEQMLSPEGMRALIDLLPVELGRTLYSCTHTTFAPTIVRGGVKTNVIPDLIELQVDVRTLPGQSEEEIRGMFEEALGPDLAGDVEVDAPGFNPATASPVDTPLWDVLQRVTGALDPGTRMAPFMVVGATDARFFRRIGSVAYGYQLLSERIPFGDFMSMFHADDERVDQESLRLTTELWESTVREFLGNGTG